MTEIESLIGETTCYDKKIAVEVRKPKSWCKSISAFANTLGGKLYFGVADGGKIIGLENPKEDADKISEIIKTRLEPIPEFQIDFIKANEGKVLIVVDVFRGKETPYYYSGDGTLEAYIRVGNESVRVTSTELKRLVLRGMDSPYDSRISPYKGLCCTLGGFSIRKKGDVIFFD